MKSPAALALLSAIIVALGAVPANATMLNRTWVSATGTDGGTCGAIAAPCASFQGALSNTAAGGEIDCLTPGDFGGSSHSLTIGQSVSIVCDRVSNGGIFSASANSNAITVNAGSGAVVYLSGLDLQGAAASEDFGVEVTGGSAVYIVHCTIRGFIYGVVVGSFTDITRVVIKNSIIVNNTEDGLLVGARTGTTNAAVTLNTVIDGNVGAAAVVTNTYGGSSAVALENSLLTGSPTGLYLQDGATGESIGPSNTVSGAIVGSPTSVPFK
jgi:hypothetical protein